MAWGANIRAIRDRLCLDPLREKSNLDVVKEWLGIDGDERDTTLNILLDSAKERADCYCNNAFVNSDGSEADIPTGVSTYCMNYVAWQAQKKGLLVKQAQVDYLGSIEFKPGGLNEFRDLTPFRIHPYTGLSQGG